MAAGSRFSLLALSDTRQRPGSAVRLRVPASDSTRLVAQLSGGSVPPGAAIVALDATGVQVLGTGRIVPGTDWMLGPSTGMHGIVGIHDVMLDAAGTDWITQDRTTFENNRSLVKLDPKTGETWAYQVRSPTGQLVRRTREFAVR